MNQSSSNTPRPPVLVVNTQIPPEQHTAMMRLQQDLNHSATAGQLQLLNVTKLHSELHRPDFVLELARRATGADKVAGSQASGLLAQAALDPAGRLWWRSKEALDTAYALARKQLFAQHQAQHTLCSCRTTLCLLLALTGSCRS